VNEAPFDKLDSYTEVIRQNLFQAHGVPWEFAVAMIEKHEKEIERDFESGLPAVDWVKRIFLEYRSEKIS